MGRTANAAIVAAWRKRLAQQRRSGLTVAEFCRREEVSPASFYAWRKRWKSEKANSPRPLFVPLEIDLAERLGDDVQIELPGGAVVRLPAQTSVELVQAAIRAAMGSASTDEDTSC